MIPDETDEILLVDDDEGHAELARAALVNAKHVVRAARRVDEALKLLSSRRFRLAILDYRLEDGDTLPILDAARSAVPPIPVIVVTSKGDERIAAESFRRGASEYVVKSEGFWDELPALVERVVRVTDAETENALLASVVRFSDAAIIAGSPTGRIASWNPAAERMFGYVAREVVGKSAAILFPAGREEEFAHAFEEIRGGRSVVRPETERATKDGTLMDVAESVSPIFGGNAQVLGAAIMIRDISAQKRLEGQVRQAQKMEAIGRLAGGVAHDFNNLLTVINGYSEMIGGRLDDADPSKAEITEIRKAGARASDLTRQLLAFSRNQVLDVKPLNLNDVVRDMAKLLQRLLGEDVKLEKSLAPTIGWVLADSGQIGQILVNLAVNARDAMPRGGLLTIATSEMDLDETSVQSHAGVRADRYAAITVRDTGSGMDAATLARAFEPFFTTKGLGGGTGLGLSTVDGIARRSGGYVAVRSEPGRGTTFTVYLPVVDAPSPPRTPGAKPAIPPRGSETILVAEDDESIRRLVCRVLTEAGYAVVQTRDGAEAVRRCREFAGPIHLVVTDFIMPTLGGPELAAGIAASRPDTRFLFMSGYTDEAMLRHGRLDPDAHYIAKPFSREALLRKVRSVLDARR